MIGAYVLAFLKALAAIPAIAGYVEEAVKAVVLWYLQNQKNEQLSRIADTAAFAARAQSQGERYEAAQRWHDTFSVPRVTSN